MVGSPGGYGGGDMGDVTGGSDEERGGGRVGEREVMAGWKVMADHEERYGVRGGEYGWQEECGKDWYGDEKEVVGKSRGSGGVEKGVGGG